jgi:hypothetical protein|tara:strand:- start:757 stop:930 length:174 start_codon:yes stop_codon:yes gene_type:complete
MMHNPEEGHHCGICLTFMVCTIEDGDCDYGSTPYCERCLRVKMENEVMRQMDREDGY